MEHASPPSSGFFPRNITKEQCKDTGMALVLLLLLLAILHRPSGHILPQYMVAAMAVHVVNMIAPRVYHYPGILWFGFSHVLGMVMSKVILTLVFLLVVTPVAVVRRWMGKDPMLLQAFKRGQDSVMVTRNHTYAPEDISKPY